MSVVVDDAHTHFMHNFPEHLSIEHAYTHIGMFLGWIIDRDLYCEAFEEEYGLQILRFKNRDIHCIVLAELFDGVLSDEQLCSEALRFCRDYYVSGRYMQDFADTLAGDHPTVYDVADTLENYDQMCAVLDRRWAEWGRGLLGGA